jgi:hypothetical protein
MATLIGASVANQAAAQPAPAPAAAAPAASSSVGANLNISPKRVTFDRNRRSATVFIFNQGTAAATFDIALVDRVMLPDGQIMPVADAEAKPELKPLLDRQKSAKDMIVVTPRRAVLEAGKGQTIRIRVAPAADATGEFRSTLTVTTVPPRDVGLTAEQAASGAPGQLRFIINSVFGLSIPIIVRLGPVDAKAGIENAKLGYADISPDGVAPAKRTPVVTFDIVRLGASSLFGNIEVRDAKARGGDPLGMARGVGVYTEIDRRSMRLPLTRAPTPGEPLEVTFSDDDSAPGTVLARGAVAP